MTATVEGAAEESADDATTRTAGTVLTVPIGRATTRTLGNALTVPIGRARGDRPTAVLDRGSATVELAIALPAVVVVLGAVLAVGAAAAAHLSCTDGARAAARQAALGSSDAEVVAVAQHVAGAGAAVRVEHDGVWVRVEVRRSAVGWLDGAGGPMTATGSATARVEP